MTLSIFISSSARIEIEDKNNQNSVLTSYGLKEMEPDSSNPERTAAMVFNAAIDGMEALVLAQHQAGIDVTTATYRTAVITAIDAITNYFGD